jgi:hypothetical protein
MESLDQDCRHTALAAREDFVALQGMEVTYHLSSAVRYSTIPWILHA